MLHEETITFSWEVPEFEYKEKSKKWYYLVVSVALIGIIISIIFSNYLFAFMLLVAGFVMINLASKQPEMEIVEISNHGIKISGTQNTYDKIDGFWIDRNINGENVLLLHVHRNINPIISVIIHSDVNPMKVRDYLLEYCDEEEIKEPLADQIIRKIGF